MKSVLVIGGGGREHALVWKLAQSPHVGKIYVAPGNGGTATIAENVPLGFTDVKGLLKFAQDKKIDLTVIGQEAASDAGVVDAFLDAGLAIFGASQAATKIESSKAFSKDLMKAQSIPTASYQTFSDSKMVLDYLKKQAYPIVIKASGLAEGKGVVIAEDIAQAKEAIYNIMVKKIFGDSGNEVVVEQFLKGQEVSIHALSDGQNAILFPASQDHKQIFDGDKGPNTGGMGVVAPLSWVTNEHMRIAKDRIVKPALKGLEAKKTSFKGCLYPGLMIDGADVNVIEFNARFGDPEAETYMRLLDSDLYEILIDCTQGKLDPNKVTWKPGVAISVAVASGGYPGKYNKGLPITGIDEAEKLPDIVVFQAGTITSSDGVKTAGGRVLYVTALGKDLTEARAKAYAAIKRIKFKGMHYRSDIGQRV